METKLKLCHYASYTNLRYITRQYTTIHSAAMIITRFFRTIRKYLPTNNNVIDSKDCEPSFTYVLVHGKVVECPITLSPITYNRVIKIIRKHQPIRPTTHKQKRAKRKTKKKNKMMNNDFDGLGFVIQPTPKSGCPTYKVRSELPIVRDYSITAYDAVTLSQYLVTSRDFRCPITRTPLYVFEILRLCYKLQQLPDSSLHQLKRDLFHVYYQSLGKVPINKEVQEQIRREQESDSLAYIASEQLGRLLDEMMNPTRSAGHIMLGADANPSMFTLYSSLLGFRQTIQEFIVHDKPRAIQELRFASSRVSHILSTQPDAFYAQAMAYIKGVIEGIIEENQEEDREDTTHELMTELNHVVPENWGDAFDIHFPPLGS